MKKYNYIYLITNTINGKIYIGKHSTDKLDDDYMGSGVFLKRAQTKYGIEHFKKDIIHYLDSEEELNEAEKFYIERLDSRNPAIGYNIAEGGQSGPGGAWEGKCLPEDMKRKISDSMKGKRAGCNNPFFGRHHTEETKILQSSRKKGTNNPNYGNKWSDDQKKNLSNKMKGRHRIYREDGSYYMSKN